MVSGDEKSCMLVPGLSVNILGIPLSYSFCFPLVRTRNYVLALTIIPNNCVSES